MIVAAIAGRTIVANEYFAPIVNGNFGEKLLLERVNDEGDRRAIWVRSTTAGRRLADRIRRERTDAVSLALEALSDNERELIERALPALERLADQLKGGQA